MGGRHPYVHYGHIRPVLGRGRNEGRPVADHRDDVVALLGQQPYQPLPQQDRVVGEDEPHAVASPPAGQLRPDARSGHPAGC